MQLAEIPHEHRQLTLTHSARSNTQTRSVLVLMSQPKKWEVPESRQATRCDVRSTPRGTTAARNARRMVDPRISSPLEHFAGRIDASTADCATELACLQELRASAVQTNFIEVDTILMLSSIGCIDRSVILSPFVQCVVAPFQVGLLTHSLCREALR